jgi:glycosyltransferase involved in cell wall biosynthesis
MESSLEYSFRHLTELDQKIKTKVSIIFSTHNASPYGSPLSLDWLANNDDGCCAEKEVCIVRTGQASVPKNRSATLAYSQLRVKEVAELVPGLLAGRHRGFRETTGDILIFLDDDVRVSKGWLDAVLEPFVDPSVHLVGCRYLPNYEVEPPEWLEQLWTETPEGRYLPYLSLLDNGPETAEISPTMIWGLCYAIRRETLTKLGGFHPDAYLWELRRYRGDGETAPSRLAEQLKLRAIYQGKTAVYHQIPRWKTTLEFCELRAYLEGISNSYCRIRREGNATGKPNLRSRLGLLAAASKIRLLGRETSIEAILARIDYSYRRGYAYHQSEVRRDPKLLAWVLRGDYWDYRLPDGWEK